MVGLLLAAAPAAAETGVASTYVDYAVACPGKRFSPVAMLAAHPSLPCGSLARVENLANGRSVVVEIVDRSPHLPRGRVIDLTPAAAKAIGSNGLARVRVGPVLEISPVRSLSGFQALWAYRIGL
jgi:rare lipoprotein A